MFEAAYQGLVGILFDPFAMFLMMVGVLAASTVAAIPGFGGYLSLTIALPYSITLPPYQAIALLLGIVVVSNTANTFPSVLIAVPGNVGSQATIVDGYPMAKRGEAKRAFGAAFTASAVGGILGAVVLLASLPVLRQLVLLLGSPEFLVLIIWGLSAIGVLSGKAPVKGLMAALFGALVSTVGLDDKTAILRFTFGGLYLQDGLNIVAVALGIFAVPELIDLAIRRSSISQAEKLGSGTWEGVKDVFRNWWLVVRCSIVGVWVGALPGLGSTVADWFAYAHAVQTEKNPANFGKGDVRGVIAPESSNNAKEGGALIPTIAFGIPGSGSYVFILIAFFSIGIVPGPKMLTDQLHLTMAMIWVLVIANLLATGLALGLSKPFAAISLLPFSVVVPMSLVLCVAASIAVSFAWGDLFTFLIFGIIGTLMKFFGWPRPPLLMAFVLGPQLERYLWLSMARYGFSWMLFPGVILLMVLIILTLFFPVLRRWREKRAGGVEEERVASFSDEAEEHGGKIGDTLATVGLIAVFGAAAIYALRWPTSTSLVIHSITGVGMFLGLAHLAVAVFALLKQPRSSLTVDSGPREVRKRMLVEFIWILGLVGSIILVGLHFSLPVFCILYARNYGAKWKQALSLAVLAEAFLVIIFDQIMYVHWPEPLLISSWS